MSHFTQGVSHHQYEASKRDFAAIADIRDFGAVAGDDMDNAAALEAAILSGLTVRIPKGDWRLATGKTIVPEFDVKIVGEAGARLKFDKALWQFIRKANGKDGLERRCRTGRYDG